MEATMANSVNRVILVGRLGKDPESKFTQGGVQVTRFSLATDEQWTDKSGEKQRRTEWHNIVAWSKLGEICQKYLVKGKLVYIEGRLQTQSWDDQEGKKHTRTEIRADNMVMLSPAPPGAGAETGGGAPAVRETEQAPAPAPESAPEIGDDDVPF
jgi:single-strand DNA-binding protein